MRGAGGTPGGTIHFFIGLTMLVGGTYLLLSNMIVHSGFGFGTALYRVGGFGLTSGSMLIPMAAGIGFIFYNARNPLGWILSLGSLGAIILGVIMSIQISLRSMTLLDMIIILILIGGGIGLFLKSLLARG